MQREIFNAEKAGDVIVEKNTDITSFISVYEPREKVWSDKCVENIKGHTRGGNIYHADSTFTSRYRRKIGRRLVAYQYCGWKRSPHY